MRQYFLQKVVVIGKIMLSLRRIVSDLLPEGKTAEEIAANDELKVQAAIISYGVWVGIAIDEIEKKKNIK